MHVLHNCIYLEVNIVHELKAAFVYLFYLGTSFSHFLDTDLILSQLLSQRFLHGHPFVLEIPLYLFYILLYLFWLTLVFNSNFDYLGVNG